MFQSANKFLDNKSGATAIEYALLPSLIAVAIASITTIGTQLQNTFNEVSGNLK
jgi:pilus assembly protein Flp/PilA